MLVSSSILLAISLLTAEHGGMTLTVDADRTTVDPGRSVFVTLRLRSPADVKASLPDLRGRVRGFSLAEDFEENPVTENDGSVVQVANWKLVPEPCAEQYKIAPFVVTAGPKMLSSRDDADTFSFRAGPIRFEPPAVREPVTGGIECDPQKDLPPFSWKLVGWCALAVLGLAALVAGIWFLVRYVARRVKEHRMSPVERAWAELDRLLKKGLPGRGRYKDFYVELTMVVRRYIQRTYGIRAPHLTTEEFLVEVGAGQTGVRVTEVEALRAFLESADLVKFAGVAATPETADAATDAARGYLKRDSASAASPGKGAK